jgi:hypothetical protein
MDVTPVRHDRRMDDFSITDELMFRVHGAIERRGFFTMGVMGGPECDLWHG